MSGWTWSMTLWSLEILLLTERQLTLRIVSLSSRFNLVGLVLLALFILGVKLHLVDHGAYHSSLDCFEDLSIPGRSLKEWKDLEPNVSSDIAIDVEWLWFPQLLQNQEKLEFDWKS